MNLYRADWVRQPQYTPSKAEQTKPACPKHERPKTSLNLLAVLTEIAEKGQPCPTNAELGTMIGRTTEHGVTSALHRLKVNGLVTVCNLNRWKRVITVAATGKSTAVSRPLTREQLPA